MTKKTPSQPPDTMDKKSEQNIKPENFMPNDTQQIEEEIPPSQKVVDLTKETLGRDPAQIPRNLDFILDIPLEISVELGRARMRIADILKLGQGSIIELTNQAGNALEILVNQKPIAKGEVVVVNEKYAIRLIEILSVMERIEKLK